MNIFVLDKNPIKAAQYMCDVHVRKLIVESAQLLSTAHRILDGEERVIKVNGRNKRVWVMADSDLDEKFYKASHWNHPCARWVRESKANYHWLYIHYLSLGYIYHMNIHNGDKIHNTSEKCDEVLAKTPINIPDVDMTPFALAMPDEFKQDDPVMSYRAYYAYKQWMFHGSPHQMKWTRREIPEWAFEFSS